MKKYAFLFPGQGAQVPGMIKDICEKYPEARKVIDDVSAITGIEITDTVVQKNDKDFKYIDREKLISIQTPQSFYFEDIFEAYEKCALEGYNSATDDSSIMKFVGKEIRFVKGSKYNIKVTTEEDLKLIELYLQNKIR